MNIKYIKTTDNKKYDLRDKRITDTDTGIATQSANGLLSSTDKKKLDGIASGAEVNQNAFSNIKIGNTTIAADGKTDTVELTAGNNITLTPDATNDKITIAATDTNTTYTFKGGTNQFTVTPSNGTAQTVSVTPNIANNVTGSDLKANTIILGNGNSGVKNSGKTIVTTLGSDDTTLPTSKAVKAAIDAIPEPMIFKGTLGKDGTITSLPAAAASNEGYTYKVITAGTYASQYAKIGDVFISNGSSWNLIPSGDEPSGTVTNIATGTGLTGGPITSSGTISHADTSSQASVSNSGRTYIQSITLDNMGHVTGIASATETVTNTDRKVCQTLTSSDWNLPLLMAYNQNTITADVINLVYRNNSIYANPSTGTITANNLKGIKLEGSLYGLPIRQAGVETVSAARYVYVKLGTFDYNSFGTLCVHLEGNHFKDELYINYGSGSAYFPLVCGWYASNATEVKEIDLVYGTEWSGDCELWLKIYQITTLNISVSIVIRGNGFTVNTAANWSATTTSPTFNETIPLIRGMFGNLSGNASSASKLTTNAGSAIQPVYFSGGVPTACSYQLNKTVPSNAVFTDTDTKVTSAANHYAPSTVSGQDKSASASGGTAGWSIDVVKGVTLNTDGKGHVTGLSVTSAKIPENPTIPNAVTGTGLKLDKIVVGNEGSKVKTSDKGITATAPSSSSDDSTVPTSKAVWTAVSNGIAAADAMIYRGTIAGGSTGAYGTLTPFANNGWTYKVTTAGKIDGKAVEIGDMLICNTDGTSAATSSNYSTIAANWDVIQANIDGAVTGPSSSTNAHVAVFDGSTGKVIKDSGYTICTSVPSDAVFTDTTYSSKSEANGGTDVSLVTTGEKYNWNRKSNLVLGNTSYTALAGNTKYAGSSTQGGAATSAEKLTNTSNIGNTNQPVYFTASGVPTAISYTINKSVPSNAAFTDTHYTTHLYAGSGTAANSATNNGNTKLTVVDNTTTRNSVTIKGTGGTTVTSDANGVVTIDSVNKNSKWFNFYTPSKVDNAYYFIISPIGGSTVTPSGTCYSIEINAVIQSSPGNYIVSSAKFVTCCVWYDSNAGLRITYPVYKNSSVPPIYYHNKAEGLGVGNETRSSNVCNIPIKVENVESLVAVNIKVDGPSVSDCICTRSYSSFNWGQGEPTSWSAI